MPAISVSSLSKTYNTGLLQQSTVQALKDISLEVEEGAIFGLLGPNGAGKTTLVKILLGLAHPTRGTAQLFGRPVGTPATRQRIGFVPENHQFPGFFTAVQTLHAYGRLADVPRTERTDRIPALLDRLDLTGRGDSKVKTFSKGMRQRLGLAQALLNDPDLLFLDEPTGGVDPVGRRAIRDLVLELRDEGKTIFLNSHLLSEVEKICTQIAILRNGSLVRQGSVEELTAVERVYDLVVTPVPESLLEEQDSALRPAPDGTPPNPDLEQYRVHAEDRATLNAVLDRLRRADVEIESITPLRQSLEDYFIDVVDSPT
ncbi:MAG: ATP-binding cassette domain-containing protein [Salinibacter sp.]